MPIVVDSTVGGASANALQGVAEVSARLSTRLDAAAWDAAAADADLMARAVIEATRELGVLQYVGVRASETQALPWPRAHVPDPDPAPAQIGHFAPPDSLPDDVIPEGVLEAHAELSLVLLQLLDSGESLQSRSGEAQLKRRKTDVLEREWFEVRQDELPRGIGKAPRVLSFLAPFLASSAQGIARC